VVSLANIAQQPVTDIHAALVFSSNARDVKVTIVAGREIYRDGAILVEGPQVKSRLAEIGEKIRQATS
jgi:cytosine/adenosine deaminase-related metal-dependent hydrolase